jgi:hypothetical protein
VEERGEETRALNKQNSGGGEVGRQQITAVAQPPPLLLKVRTLYSSTFAFHIRELFHHSIESVFKQMQPLPKFLTESHPNLRWSNFQTTTEEV